MFLKKCPAPVWGRKIGVIVVLCFLAVPVRARAEGVNSPDKEISRKKAACGQKGGVFGQSPWDKPPRCFMPGDPLFLQMACINRGGVLLDSEQYGGTPDCITKDECDKMGGTRAVNRTSLLEYCFVSPLARHEQEPGTATGLRQKLVEALPKEFIFSQFYYYLQKKFSEFKCRLTQDGRLELTDGGRHSPQEIEGLGYGGSWEVTYKTLMVHYALPLNRELTGRLNGTVNIKLGIANGRLTFDGQAVDNGPLLEGSLRERLKD